MLPLHSMGLLAAIKELIDSFYKLGMGISYPNVLFLRDIWTMHDLEQCSVCPDEINEEGTK